VQDLQQEVKDVRKVCESIEEFNSARGKPQVRGALG
jgi:hypothetical protein